MAEGDGPQTPRAELTPHTLPPRILSRNHALGVPLGIMGPSSSLTTHWRRERRRLAMEHRYGEDFGLGDDDDLDLMRPED